MPYLCIAIQKRNSKQLTKMERTVITSATGKKEATIIYTPHNKYVAMIDQIIHDGISVQKDFYMMKFDISTFARAEKWVQKNMN